MCAEHVVLVSAPGVADRGEGADDDCHHLFGGEVAARGCLRAVEMKRLYAVDAVREFPFSRPGVPSLTVAGGEIRRLRDYVDILAAFAAMGHELQRPMNQAA